MTTIINGHTIEPYAYLRGVDLSGVTLTYAHLAGADLQYADLSHADLSYADLSHADLSYADLSHARLDGTNMDFADLEGTNLTGVSHYTPEAWQAEPSSPFVYREGETRVVDPVTGGAKGQKLARHELLPPESLTAIAERFGLGAAKYEDRNWEKGYAWSLSYGALQRHLLAFWGGEDVDEEFGDSHLAAAGFHILVLLSFIHHHPGGDDRPTIKGTS